MKKLAVFVEGYTELQFVDRLFAEIAPAHSVVIEHRRITGGVSATRRMHMLKAARVASGEKFFVLIVDCTGDEQVKTRILEEHQRLTSSGYTGIIGIRDVRPKFSYAQIPRLEAGLPLYVKTSLIPVSWILSIMEIEAWFLAEHTHFHRINAAITTAAIRTTLGLDPEYGDMSQRANPAVDLNSCYGLGGCTYTKSSSNATIAALDYNYIYLELRNRIPYLDKLLRLVDDFVQ